MRTNTKTIREFVAYMNKVMDDVDEGKIPIADIKDVDWEFPADVAFTLGRFIGFVKRLTGTPEWQVLMDYGNDKRGMRQFLMGMLTFVRNAKKGGRYHVPVIAAPIFADETLDDLAGAVFKEYSDYFKNIKTDEVQSNQAHGG